MPRWPFVDALIVLFTAGYISKTHVFTQGAADGQPKKPAALLEVKF